MATAKRELLAASSYEGDFYSWALGQARLMREGRLAELDLEHLVDEVEALARGEAKELRSRYATLLHHLLKWQFQPERRSHSRVATIVRERDEIPEHLLDNPGLKPRQRELYSRAYRLARADAAAQTNLPLTHFPAENPYTLEQALDPDFWPGGPEVRQPAAGAGADATSVLGAPRC